MTAADSLKKDVLAHNPFQRINRNVVKKALAEMLPRLLSFAITALLARLLGNGGFGQIAYGLAVAGVVSIFVDFGWNNLTLRHLAAGGGVGIIRKVIRLKAVTAVVTLLLTMVSFRFFFSSYIPLSLLFWLLFVGIANAFQDFWGAVSTGLEKIEWEISAKVMSRGVVLLGFPILLMAGVTTGNAAVFLALSNVAGAVIAGLWILRRIQGASSGAIVPSTRGILREGAVFGVVFAVWTLYTRQDILLLGFFRRPDVEVGYYATAARLLEFGRALPLVFQTALIPVFASLAREPREMARVAQRIGLRLAPVAVLIPVLAFLLGPYVIRIFFGASYLPATRPFSVAAAGLGVMTLNVVLIAALIAIRQERRLLLSTIVATLVNAALNVALIPHLSYVAPGWASLGSEIVWFVLNFLFFAQHIRSASPSPA